ncbi:transposase [Acidaminococcus intestini]|uniref:Transposase n=1 Tax=Acidaminococcus intestini (strain RyC-MR95) TaxID=568816 RepID=G4Q596_ACIIR|nr:transposase [Acidaminococcus intestini]AEQ23274.1 transposase [Acidaminococcus intestini RyC-MR95]
MAAKRELNKWLAMVMGYNLDAFKGILRSFKDWEAAIIQAIIQPYSNGFNSLSLRLEQPNYRRIRELHMPNA